MQSVTDAKGNVYNRAVGPTLVSGLLTQSIYYAKNIAAATAGANTVTVRFSTAAVYPDIRILEYGGIDRTNPVDAVGASTGSDSMSSSGMVLTTYPNNLLFSANTVRTSTSSAGGGFAARHITSPDGDIAQDRAVSSTAYYQATAPLSSAGAWVMQLVAFRAAAN